MGTANIAEYVSTSLAAADSSTSAALYRPIMALVGGLEAPPGRVMGHAGAWAAPGEPDAKAKHNALQQAGAVMVSHPEKFGAGMKWLLDSRAGRCAGAATVSVSQETF